MPLFSNAEELRQLRKVLTNYLRLPFSGDTIPGATMESVLAEVRGGMVLHTYDFVDVVNEAERVGWQVKSTKEKTPVTWKRAKIANSPALIEASRESDEGVIALGRAIINFCNKHIEESFDLYKIDSIGYVRLILKENGIVTYFERMLCRRENPILFNPDDFEWRWSNPKKTKKKEQLSAFHGIKKDTGQKWWAWHGLGENQLHFSGESVWWPDNEDEHSFSFAMPSPNEKLTLKDLAKFLSQM